nr:DUF6531 domain-containing protein [Escherichia coli]
MLSRTYSSYRTKTPAPVGIFGPGWKAPSDIRLQIRDDALVLNDNGGRSIHFEPLLPGEAVYSRSESLWLPSPANVAFDLQTVTFIVHQISSLSGINKHWQRLSLSNIP